MNDSTLRAAVAEVLEVSPDALWNELELTDLSTYDSTARLSLMVFLSDVMGEPISLAVLESLRTYGDIVALLSGYYTAL